MDKVVQVKREFHQGDAIMNDGAFTNIDDFETISDSDRSLLSRTTDEHVPAGSSTDEKHEICGGGTVEAGTLNEHMPVSRLKDDQAPTGACTKEDHDILNDSASDKPQPTDFDHQIGDCDNLDENVDDDDGNCLSYEFREEKFRLGGADDNINKMAQLGDFERIETGMKANIAHRGSVKSECKEDEKFNRKVLHCSVKTENSFSQSLEKGVHGISSGGDSLQSRISHFDHSQQLSAADFDTLILNPLMPNPDNSGEKKSKTSIMETLETSSTPISSAQTPTMQQLEYLASKSSTTYSHTPQYSKETQYTQSLLHFAELQQNRNPEELISAAEEQSRSLHESSTLLVDLLFQYFSTFSDFNSATTGKTQNVGAEVKRGKGLTLPASALGWLTTWLYPENLAERPNNLSLTMKRAEYSTVAVPGGASSPTESDMSSFFRYLLARCITHLRVTGDAWPSRPEEDTTLKSPNGRKHRATRQSFVRYFEKKENGSKKRGMSLFRRENNKNQRQSNSWTVPPNIFEFLSNYHLLQVQPRVDMTMFPNLTVLILDGVAPEWLLNLNMVWEKLTVLRVEKGCIFDVARFLLCDNDNTDQCMYPVLTHLKLSRCAIGELSGLDGRQYERVRHLKTQVATSTNSFAAHGVTKVLNRDFEKGKERYQKGLPPLSMMKKLVSLNLSHNEIVQTTTALSGLSLLPELAILDLSFNRISSMSGAFFMLGNITTLVLTGNQLVNVHGLDRLYSLERLCIDENLIRHLPDITGLGKLPKLMKLDVKGNPLERDDPINCRLQVLNIFKEFRFSSMPKNATFRNLIDTLPVLDGRAVSKKELVALRGLTYVPSMVSLDRVIDLSSAHMAAMQAPFAESFHFENNASLPEIVVSVMLQSKRQRRTVRCSKSRVAHIRDEIQLSAKQKRLIGKANTSVNRTKVSEHSGFGPLSSETRSNVSVPFTLVEVIRSLSVKVQSEWGRYEILVRRSIRDEKQVTETSVNSKTKRGDDCFIIPSSDNVHISPAEDAKNIIFERQNTEERSIISMHGLFDEESKQSEVRNYDVDDLLLDLASQSSRHQDCEEPVCQLDESRDVSLSQLEVEPAPPYATKSLNILPVDTTSSYRQSDKNSSSVSDSRSSSADVHTTTQLYIQQSATSPIGERNLDSGLCSDQFDFNLAEKNSVYDGPEACAKLFVINFLETYFRSFVFPTGLGNGTDLYCNGTQPGSTFRSIPRIQLNDDDQNVMIWTLSKKAAQAPTIMSLSVRLQLSINEQFVAVAKEEVLACGIAAMSRLSLNSQSLRGFHGELLYNEDAELHMSESRSVIVCLSNSAVYLIPDFARGSPASPTKRKRRSFPSAIPSDATFREAFWPHSFCRHPIQFLTRITIGFEFQRLILHFKLPEAISSYEFTYIIFTCSKRRTIELLQTIQSLVGGTDQDSVLTKRDILNIDNDDRAVLDALGTAVAPDPVGVVLHYQVLRQRWKNGERDAVRRVCALTDSKIYLLDENYIGDGTVPLTSRKQKNGDVVLSVVDSAQLSCVSEIWAADESPLLITLVIKAPSMLLSRSHRWRLICKDGESAEKLVEDVRKATSHCS